MATAPAPMLAKGLHYTWKEQLTQKLLSLYEIEMATPEDQDSKEITMILAGKSGAGKTTCDVV